MSITKRLFGTLSDGTEIFSWTLTNERGLQAEVLDYGVIIRSIMVPDAEGNPVDVVLGYNSLEEYVRDGCYLGAVVGRCANRIRGASFELNGKTYALCANNGANHLHGGKIGFNKCVWSARQVAETVEFSRLSPDGEEGYPGNLQVKVTIGWEGDTLILRYEAQTDQDTIVNLTNHSYFNLNGKRKINDHLLQIQADSYTVNGRDGIPTGEVASVEGTAMDFRTPKPIGRDAKKKEPCVDFFRGYDSNFVVSGHPIATAVGNRTGIKLVVDTDLPGVQLYTANALVPSKGKNRRRYGFRSAFCLETQHFPDSIHHPEWPTCILRAGEKFHSFTTFTFARNDSLCD
jgi:aldose 1-epimerase